MPKFRPNPMPGAALFSIVPAVARNSSFRRSLQEPRVRGPSRSFGTLGWGPPCRPKRRPERHGQSPAKQPPSSPWTLTLMWRAAKTRLGPPCRGRPPSHRPPRRIRAISERAGPADRPRITPPLNKPGPGSVGSRPGKLWAPQRPCRRPTRKTTARHSPSAISAIGAAAARPTWAEDRKHLPHTIPPGNSFCVGAAPCYSNPFIFFCWPCHQTRRPCPGPR